AVFQRTRVLAHLLGQPHGHTGAPAPHSQGPLSPAGPGLHTGTGRRRLADSLRCASARGDTGPIHRLLSGRGVSRRWRHRDRHPGIQRGPGTTAYEEQARALGAIFEAATQVDKLARSGQYAEGPAACLVQSILERSPATTLDVYGGSHHQIRGGLQALEAMLERDTAALQRDALRYA